MRPTLVIGARFGGGEGNQALAEAIRVPRKARVTSLTLNSDHSFADHRLALAASVVDWLQRQAAVKFRLICPGGDGSPPTFTR